MRPNTPIVFLVLMVIGVVLVIAGALVYAMTPLADPAPMGGTLLMGGVASILAALVIGGFALRRMVKNMSGIRKGVGR